MIPWLLGLLPVQIYALENLVQSTGLASRPWGWMEASSLPEPKRELGHDGPSPWGGPWLFPQWELAPMKKKMSVCLCLLYSLCCVALDNR